MSTSQIRCQLLWKLCRKHGWGSPVPEDALVDLALKSSNQGKGRDVVRDLLQEPYIGYQEGKGYSVKNDPDSQAQAACRLVQDCGYSELRVESTLSRFDDAGGFDAYDRDEVSEQLDSW